MTMQFFACQWGRLWTGLALVLLLAPSLAHAELEEQNKKRYGNCSVSTHVNVFTDKKSHNVKFSSEAKAPPQTVLWGHLSLIESRNGSLAVSLDILGELIHSKENETVPVMIRVDKGDLIRVNAVILASDSNEGLSRILYWIDDDTLTRRLLHDLAHGQKVHIKVGDNYVDFPLDSCRAAVADFRRRTGLDSEGRE